MEILIGMKNDMRKLGLLRFDHPYSKIINFGQYFLIIGIWFLNISAASWYLMFESKTFIEYIDCGMPVYSGFLNMATYCTLIWQRKKIFDLIMEYDATIAKRKSFFTLISLDF